MTRRQGNSRARQKPIFGTGSALNGVHRGRETTTCSFAIESTSRCKFGIRDAVNYAASIEGLAVQKCQISVAKQASACFFVLPIFPILKLFHENGEILYAIDGLSPEGKEWRFAIRKVDIAQIRMRGTWVRLVQLLNIVSPGLIMAKHIFRGLKRPLCEGENMHADETKLTYTWKPIYDYDWEERHRFDAEEIRQRPAPPGKVFVVTASPNIDTVRYRSVDCWLNRWNWVQESLTLSQAPVNHESRYTECLK